MIYHDGKSEWNVEEKQRRTGLEPPTPDRSRVVVVNGASYNMALPLALPI